METNSKPRRKHKLKHGSSPKRNSSTSPPQSPFKSPLRFAAKKSILRISSPKATKSPVSMSRLLPGSLPLEEKETPWDENDEEYPEVPKTPKLPQHESLDEDAESDGISSVSSGSKNGDVVAPDDETDEEWEYKEFDGTEHKPQKKRKSGAGKKVGKLLGKHGRRLFKGVRRRGSQQNLEEPKNSQPQSQQMSKESSSREMENSLQPESSTSEKQQQQPQQQPQKQEPKPQKPRRIIQIRREPKKPKQQPQQQQTKEPEPSQPSLSSQPRQPLPTTSSHEEEPSSQSLEAPPQAQPLLQAQSRSAPPQAQARKQALIRIKRRKPTQPQSPDTEFPRNEPRQVLKGKDRDEAPMRSDALWTQTVMTGDNSDPEVEYNQEGNKIVVEKPKEEKEALPKENEEEADTTEEAENTVRSDHLWAQTMMKTDQGHPLEDSVGILTPDMMSPTTPTASAQVVTKAPLSQVPFLASDDDEQEEHDDDASSSKPDKMDASTGRSTHYTDTTASEIPTVTPAGSETGRVIENSDLEDGNIVDEDDLLDLPSDEQDEILQEHHHNDDVVHERDANTSDYYLKQVLSEDTDDEDEDDDEGGVVSEHDEEEHLSQSRRQSVALSDTPSDDSNSELIDASDREEEEDDLALVASHADSNVMEEFEMEQVDHSNSGSLAEGESASDKPPPTREVVGDNLNTSFDSNFTLDDSDLAEMEKESPAAAMSIGQRSTLTNMQHRLLSMRTIKDTYKRKLVMQEQESVQLQVQLLASQYEAKEAKMSLQNAQAALLHEQAKLKASENEREHQKELLQNLQEQNAIVTAQLQKTKETKPPHDANSSFASQQSDQSYDMKLASMEEQLLVQDEEMDQLAAQIQELKHKTVELEAAKGIAEQKLKEALEREERLKTQLTTTTGQPMVDSEPISGDVDSADKQEIQRLGESVKANEVRYETESAALRKQLEDVQQQHELESAKLQEQMEANKKLADSAAEEAEVARKKLLEELAVSKLEHSKAIEELKESLSKAHQEEKSKLRTRYTTELELLEDEIEGSHSELSV